MTRALTPKDLRLVELVSATTRGDWASLQALRQAAPEGEPDLEWREALVQSHLFLGFPRVVEAFEQLALVGGLGAHGSDPRELPPTTPWIEHGTPLFEAIYADLAQPVRRRLHQHHPDFADWIAGHAYGRVLSRPGLEPHRRELLALVCLLLGGLDRQLASHTRGAVRLGASARQVQALLESQRAFLVAADFERLAGVAMRFANEAGTPNDSDQ